MADKPTVDPKWATNQLSTEVKEPVQSFKDSGIAAGSTVARRNFNWMFNAISQWIDWIRSYAMDRTLNLSDLENKATSRANLGANNAANLTTGIIPTARLPDSSLTATGAVTGTVTLPKSGNASIALSASPTLTLSGDVTGSATFTNLANATLTTTVADNSHSHDSSTITSASTTVKGVVQLSTSTSSTSTTLAATSSAVKSANDNANSKLAKSSNLDDVSNYRTARENLGIFTVGSVLGTNPTSAAFAPSGWGFSRVKEGYYRITHNLGTTSYTVAGAGNMLGDSSGGSAGEVTVSAGYIGSNHCIIQVNNISGSDSNVPFTINIIKN